LREAILARGFEVATLRSERGEAGAQAVGDTDWIRDAAAAGQIILTKDNSIRRNLLEKRAMRDNRPEAFVLEMLRCRGRSSVASTCCT
jgi:hypothetical protein